LRAYFIMPELAGIDPDLIFAFGNDAWEMLAGELAITPTDEKRGPDLDAGIT